MGVKVVQSTADIKVGDVLECPHGVIELVTDILDDLRYEATVMFANSDSPKNHIGCPRRVIHLKSVVPENEIGDEMPRKKKEHLFDKYTVTKNDGFTDPEAVYFVLRLDTDPSARAAALNYADSCLSIPHKRDLAHEILELVKRSAGE